MDLCDPNERLSRISTLWTLIFKAHQGPTETVGAAQRKLLERYGGAVHRYLGGALRDTEAADELFQEFALRFLRGDFRNANPERGRFRDFLKAALYHLIVDHQKRRAARPLELSSNHEPPEPSATTQQECDQHLLSAWRDELMDLTWVALEEFERQTGQPYHTILQFRTENPLVASEELADQIGIRLGKKYTIHAIRQALHRAREKFSDLLLREIEQSLEEPEQERLEQELIDLGLLTYCQPALDRRFPK